MSTRPVILPTPKLPAHNPLPIQNYQVTKEDFENPDRFNVLLTQLVTAVQAMQGIAGPTILPSGVDVVGGRVTGLGKPEHDSDAISSAHAEGNFSPEVVSPQLDLGGTHALKGLTILQSQASQAAAAIKAILAILSPGTGVSGTIILAKITGGGANGSITVVDGIITAFVNPT